MGKKQEPGALSAETREMVLMALARKAADGNTAAARIYFSEYRQQNAPAAGEDYSLLDKAFEEIKDLQKVEA